MILRELLDKIEKVRGQAEISAEKINVIIEDNDGNEYVIGNVYFSEPDGIGFDIERL